MSELKSDKIIMIDNRVVNRSDGVSTQVVKQEVIATAPKKEVTYVNRTNMFSNTRPIGGSRMGNGLRFILILAFIGILPLLVIRLLSVLIPSAIGWGIESILSGISDFFGGIFGGIGDFFGGIFGGIGDGWNNMRQNG